MVDYLLGKIDGLEGKKQDARRRLFSAYETHKNRLGENDDDTIRVMWGVINHLVGQREFAEAKPLMEKGIAHRMRLYGPHSMATIEVKENLAFVLTNLEEYDQAETLLRECVQIAENGPVQGIVQAHFANSCRNKLGSCLNLQGKHAEAAEVVMKPIEYHGWSDENEWKRAHAQGILGEALTELGQYEKAEKMLLEAQRGFEEQTSKMVPTWRARSFKKMATRFVRLYEKTARQSDQDEWQQVLDGLEE